MDDEQLNIGLTGRHRSPLMQRLAAMAAPIATDAGAVRLVATAPLNELLDERRFHYDSNFMSRIGDLQRLVTDQFPQLDPAAYKLLLEAQRYVGVVEDLLGRVLDEGGEARNFSLLDPEEYLEAARTASVDELSAFAADIAFDPARPWLGRGARSSKRCRSTARSAQYGVPPPEPPAPSDEDPVEQLQARANRATHAVHCKPRRCWWWRQRAHRHASRGRAGRQRRRRSPTCSCWMACPSSRTASRWAMRSTSMPAAQ